MLVNWLGIQTISEINRSQQMQERTMGQTSIPYFVNDVVLW